MGDHWLTGERPEQEINELREKDVVVIHFPDGSRRKYEVQQAIYDVLRGCQITLYPADD